MCYDGWPDAANRSHARAAFGFPLCNLRTTRRRHFPVFEKNPHTHHQRLVGEDGGRMLEWKLLNFAFFSSISRCRDSYVTSTFFGTSR